MQQIIAEKGITIRQGDILFMRTGKPQNRTDAAVTDCPGYVQAYAQLSQPDREELSKRRGSPGLGQGKETTEWLWKSQFAAVVADSVAFECSRMSRIH